MLNDHMAFTLGTRANDAQAIAGKVFERMDDFRMTASVHLDHGLGRWVAWVGVLLVGQGMYEHDLDEVDARFALFRRHDGGLHFVREFWCADAIRVFDSDFLVREVAGEQALVEHFVDLGVAAQMITERLDDGGLSMQIVRVFVRGPVRDAARGRSPQRSGHDDARADVAGGAVVLARAPPAAAAARRDPLRGASPDPGVTAPGPPRC